MSALSIFSKKWLESFASKGEASSIGDIRHSILTEAQFQAINGTGWILCDGRSITGSKLSELTGNSTAPDARGLFLRGKNNGRLDGNEDPAGERAIGHFQMDSIQGHRHFSTVTINTGTGTPNNTALAQGNGNNTGGANDNTGVKDTITDPTYGTIRQGNETRVKNLAVNIFIRIN